MNNLTLYRASNARLNEELCGGLRNCLDNRYGQVLSAARATWDRKFAGREASDSCVSVRVSGRSLSAGQRAFAPCLAYGL